MIPYSGMIKIEWKNILTKIKKTSVASFVAFFVIFSVVATISSALKENYIFSSDQPLVEEELEKEIALDEKLILNSSEIVYLKIVHDHHYLDSSVHAGYAQPLYRPPAIS